MDSGQTTPGLAAGAFAVALRSEEAKGNLGNGGSDACATRSPNDWSTNLSGWSYDKEKWMGAMDSSPLVSLFEFRAQSPFLFSLFGYFEFGLLA